MGCKSPASFSPEKIYDEAQLKLKRGDLKGAVAESDAALLHFADLNGEWHWRFTLLKAEALVQQRLNKDALVLLAPGLPQSLENTDLGVWEKLTKGSANCFLLNFAEADQLLRQAATLAAASHPDLKGEVTLRQGTLAFVRGDIPSAEGAYSQTLVLARGEHSQFLEAAALGSLGLIATRQEHYDEAIDRNQQALQLSRELHAQTSVAKILVNLGWEYLELGDYENALVLFKQAVEDARLTGRFSAQINTEINIGNVYHGQGNFSDARSAYDHALALARAHDEKTSVVLCLQNLAIVNLESGNSETSEAQIQEANSLVQLGQDNTLALNSSLISGRISSGEKDYRRAQEYFQRVIHDPSGRNALRWQAEARSAQAYSLEGKKPQAEKEFIESLKTIDDVRSSVTREESRLSFLSNAISFYSAYIDFLVSQNRWDDALEIAELSRARTLAEGLGEAPKSLEFPLKSFHPRQIARKQKATLLFYWIGQKHSYLWAIAPTSTRTFTLPPAQEINALVKPYREAAAKSADVLATDTATGKKLYSMLIEPAEKLIAANSRVVILPAESLYGLNFETLIVPGPQPHFWIEDATITSASSLTLLAAASALSATFSGKTLLLVGDTVQPSADFPALPQASAEMKQIEQYFPAKQSLILKGAQATPTAYLTSDPRRFAYLHFVTHGTASQTRPLESAVILSKEGDGYKLYARDIVNHPLHAELVTISACTGAGTRAYSGEGLVGLSWAFLRAGAHNVIAALWEVSDSSTPQLMNEMYSGLSGGKDPATALRAAKLSLLHRANGDVFKKPFYWAPFQLYAGS
ncbi:MAG TPA: CHAT domain-containing tetratricopeptide repeat protein [Candidatus Acidoferrum sp.]